MARLHQLVYLVPVVAGVALGPTAATAVASTATVVETLHPPECKYVPPGRECLPLPLRVLVFEGGPGEANEVSVARVPEGFRVSDRGAALEPGAGCARVDSGSVTCSGVDSVVFVRTGGGDDTVRLQLEDQAIADGGPGDDIVTGGAGRDKLYGGRGDDVLRGGHETDHLFDGSLRDRLRAGDRYPLVEETLLPVVSGGRGRDSFRGGPGHDYVGYQGRRGAVRVDLGSGAPVGGARGERDSVTGVESAFGGAGDDRLAGSRRTNWLDGGDGDDVILARRGNDQIEGGLGRNTIFAGSGKDSVNPQYRGSDFGAERIFCGPGADRVSWLFPTDFVNDDCESLGFDFLADGGLIGGDVTSHLPLRAGGGRLVITAPELYCLPIVDPGCRLELALLVHGRHGSRGTAPPRGTVLGTASHTFAPDERKPASLALSADGAAILRRHGSLRVRVRVTEPGADQPAGYLTVLRAPRREGHGA